MAESLDVRENEMQQISNPAYLRCIDSAGNSGLVDVDEIKKTPYKFINGGIVGGSPTTWVGLGSFYLDMYYTTRVNLVVGPYHIVDNRNNIDVVIAGNTDNMFISGSGYNHIGYVIKSESSFDLYLKVNSTEMYNGWVFGTSRQDLDRTTTEPSGIVYVP